jgi:putative DNA primase/helicase
MTSGDPFNEVVIRLNGVRSTSTGNVVALCPVHEADGLEHTPSLSVSTGTSGKVLIHCFGRRCSFEELRDALERLGLPQGVLSGDASPSPRPAPIARASIPAPESSLRKGLIGKVYPYRDETGTIVHETVRYVPKGFGQRRPDGRGGRTYNLNGIRTVIYRLPELLASPADSPVFLVEGEKDAENVASFGLVATTVPMGAGTWKPHYAQWFAGRNVVILPDNDTAGIKGAEHWATRLAGIASTVTVVALPGLPEHGDVSDWIDAIRASDPGADPAAMLMALAHEAPAWTPTRSTTLASSLAPSPAITPDTLGDDGSDPLPVNGSDPPGGSAGSDIAPDGYRNTDTGNAERVAARHAGVVRWVEDRSIWSVFTGRRWEDDPDGGRVSHLAVGVLRGTHAWATGAEGDAITEPARRAAVRLKLHALKSEGAGALRSLLERLKAIPGVTVPAGAFDRDRHLLNILDGTVDLRDGTVGKHDATHLITRVIPQAYDPKAPATSDLWNDTLERFQPDAEVRDFLRVFAGYCATGETRERKMVIAYGIGRNGKGTLMEPLVRALGPYAKVVQTATFERGGSRDNPYAMADLRGARLASAAESNKGSAFNEALVKSVTGGGQQVTRAIYERSVSWEPEFKLVLETNNKPRIKEAGPAIWDRVTLVPFDVRLEESDVDPTVKQRLVSGGDEQRAILAWVISGAVTYYADGLRVPKAIRRASDAFRADSDELAEFLDTRCLREDANRVRARDLHQAHSTWREDEHEKPLTSRALKDALTDRGYVQKRDASGIWWKGIRLRGAGEAANPFPDDRDDQDDQDDPDQRASHFV